MIKLSMPSRCASLSDWLASHVEAGPQAASKDPSGLKNMQQHLAKWLIQRHQQTIRRKPDHPKAWSKLYTICTQELKPEEFVQFCEEIIRAHPGNRHAWTFLQLTTKDDAAPRDLLAFAKELVALHPDDE